jgi:hypothetical protein
VTPPDVLARSWSEAGARLAVAERAGGPGLNQDGWMAEGLGSGVKLAVVDGAGIRVPLGGDEPRDSRELVDRVVESLRRVPESKATEPASWLEIASESIRQWILGYPAYREMWPLLEGRPRSLGSALSELSPGARTRIREALADALGDLSLLDTRYLRLLLPACVITAVFLEPTSGRVRFAHLGDTMLARVADGTVTRVTQDQMARFDGEAIDEAVALVERGLAVTMSDAAADPHVQRLNRLNGIRHNYARPDGELSRSEGCGVINGMSAMSAFMEVGSFTLERGEKVALLSDGMALPLSLSTGGSREPAAPVESLSRELGRNWRVALERMDPAELIRALDAILDADPDRVALPRLKDRDDATAVTAAEEES